MDVAGVREDFALLGRAPVDDKAVANGLKVGGALLELVWPRQGLRG